MSDHAFDPQERGSADKSSDYAKAVRRGQFVAVPGIVSFNNDRTVAHVGDPAGQLQFVLALVQRSLEEVGATLGDVIRTRIFVARIEDWLAVHEAHQEGFGRHRPASTIVGGSLIHPDLLVEMEVDAIVLGDESR